MKWKEINKYKTMNSDGDVEEYTLERNDNGVFRIRNDFGNIKIEFDTMTGTEFARKLLSDIEDEVELDLNSIWNDNDFDDTEEDD